MKMRVLLWVVVLLGLLLPCSADSRPVDSSPTAGLRRLLLLPRPLLGEELSFQVGGGGGSSSLAVGGAQEEEEVEKWRRSEEPPISLDLTFHLLRGVLEMARAEQIAQQADSNRKMMDTFGK
ncbi:corticoliberin-like [Anarrhichthys ocellatus]|uniref:corticoliberin-like n=1 Tax=Anarrhichthys ocellatus TaxID=433405 RepID=UPI0012ED1D84|nr:corticoliberin-like [Anarrhichthys ocellatus]